MNNVLIFAGGTGQRMNSGLPKQFMKVYGMEIIVHTLLKFNSLPAIDNIVVVCLEEYINNLQLLIKKYELDKVCKVLAGGKNGQESIFNGLDYIYNNIEKKGIVLIHDGVRPLIDSNTILKNITICKENGNCITVAKSQETIISNEENLLVLDRSKCFLGRAPQTFYINDIYNCHLKAKKENLFNFVDSAMLMNHYGFKLNYVEGPQENIKITTKLDYYVFKGIMDAYEDEQNFGDK